ncbi:phosphorylase [Roseiarcus sp.]|uniref:phosphorylase family protein n=1 Tax=Roseiarcus sp. TaxID=1969460 RepID=UPI003D14A748
MNRSTPAGPAASVLIVSGLKREAAILAGPGRLAICGDASTLRAKLAELTCQPIILVISWGVCGGLDPRLRPGDLILGAEVVSAEGRINTDEAVTSSLAQRLIDAGARVAVERVAGASSPVSTARAKAELRLATGAAAVDMESLIAGRFALERRTPFAILRAVADPADRDLPPLVLSAVDSDGRVKAAAVLGDLVRSPGQFTGLVAAARDGRAAFRALSRCRGLLPGLFLGLGPANL